jgi:heat shock protein HslJ
LAHTPVSDPSRYTLTLADDGSFRLAADCNSVAGTYVTDGDEITMSFGPSTLVACPEGSQGDQFMSLLHTVDTFSIDGGDLTLHLADAAGTMRFTADGSGIS